MQYHRGNNVYCRIHCNFIEWYRLFEMVVNFKQRKQGRTREREKRDIFMPGRNTQSESISCNMFSIDEKSNSHTHTCMHIINIYCIVYYGAIKSYQWNARYLCASFRLNWGPTQYTHTHILDETTIGNGWNKSYVRILNWP